ncbi:MAG: zinc ABC transporter solute-binding protein, partial [Microcoleus sp. SIO2G3]|nr:zinc ABC transporter solute-binding protein [Microcoleus sp. SIO2G3]
MKISSPWRFGLLALTASLVACNASTPTTQPQTSPTAQTPAASAALNVVATSSVLCDLAETIAAQTIDLTCLVKAGVDPHVYEPTPDDRRAIEDAQVILYSGYDFEPELIRLIEASSNAAPKVAVG